jgi:hypothetical protein
MLFQFGRSVRFPPPAPLNSKDLIVFWVSSRATLSRSQVCRREFVQKLVRNCFWNSLRLQPNFLPLIESLCGTHHTIPDRSEIRTPSTTFQAGSSTSTFNLISPANGGDRLAHRQGILPQPHSGKARSRRGWMGQH